jgi:hypothetical protein
MSIKPHLCALLFSAFLMPAASAQDITRTPNATTPPSTTGSAVSDPSSQAPIGHRQPRAADIPANRSSADDDAWLNRVNRDIDSKLTICRGC